MTRLTISSTIKPPTMTMANERCKSEPMSCDMAAGSRPRAATNMVQVWPRIQSNFPALATRHELVVEIEWAGDVKLFAGTRRTKPLRTLDDLQRLRCLQSLAKDGFPGGDFSNGIGMDHVAAVGQCVAKGNFNAGRAGFQREMLVPNCRCTPVVGDGHDDHRQVEGVGGAVRYLDGAVNSVVVDLRRLKPFEQHRSGDQGSDLFVNDVRGMAGVFDFQGEGESPGFGGTSSQKPLRGERDSF